MHVETAREDKCEVGGFQGQTSRLLDENNSPAACVRESSACETEFAYIYITVCAQGLLGARAVRDSRQV